MAKRELGDEDAGVIQKSIEALGYRLQGLSYSKIGAIMGISGPYAHKLVRRRLREQLGDKPEQFRKLELARLDKLWEHAYSAVLNTPEIPGLVNKEAVAACLKIMERRASMLGLDIAAPKQNVLNLNIDQSQNTVQFYLPSNGRDDPPVLPAPVIDVDARVVASPDDEEEDDVQDVEAED